MSDCDTYLPPLCMYVGTYSFSGCEKVQVSAIIVPADKGAGLHTTDGIPYSEADICKLEHL